MGAQTWAHRRGRAGAGGHAWAQHEEGGQLPALPPPLLLDHKPPPGCLRRISHLCFSLPPPNCNTHSHPCVCCSFSFSCYHLAQVGDPARAGLLAGDGAFQWCGVQLVADGQEPSNFDDFVFRVRQGAALGPMFPWPFERGRARWVVVERPVVWRRRVQPGPGHGAEPNHRPTLNCQRAILGSCAPAAGGARPSLPAAKRARQRRAEPQNGRGCRAWCEPTTSLPHAVSRGAPAALDDSDELCARARFAG